jgi:hypothetical protein
MDVTDETGQIVAGWWYGYGLVPSPDPVVFGPARTWTPMRPFDGVNANGDPVEVPPPPPPLPPPSRSCRRVRVRVVEDDDDDNLCDMTTIEYLTWFVDMTNELDGPAR